MSANGSPPAKRVKLELPATPIFRVKSETPAEGLPQPAPEEEDVDEDRCSICLQSDVADRDRAIVPHCAHEFCFECLLIWTEQSRRCPLCSQGVGPYLIHNIRSRYDYQKHYLNPLPTSPVPLRPLPPRQNRAPRRRPRDSEWGRRDRRDSDEADKLDRSISKRKWIYEHDLYAKHVASNAYTRYRPYPTPAQFAASPDLISRTTMFLRRELQVWVNLDVEFLTQFIISIMKGIDIRSESAVKLLSEFLDLDAPYVEGGRHINAEHFAHEVYSYVRSPYKDLFVYDSVAQYEVTEEVPALGEEPRRRWREPSRSPSPARPARDTRRPTGSRRVRSRSLSSSRSPRRRTSSRDRKLNEHTSRGSGNRQWRNTSRHRESSEQQLSTTNGYSDPSAGQIIGRIQYNRPQSASPPPPPTAGAATETTEILDPKGKARIISGALSSEKSSIRPVSPVPRAVEVPAPLLAEEPLAAQAARRPARVRNQSLFESVQAHLGAGGPSGKQRESRALAQSTPTASKFPAPRKTDDDDAPPSFLSRLSDPAPQTSRSRGGLPLAPNDIITTPAAVGVADVVSVEKESPSRSYSKPSLSAPEIMARTRARLAKLARTDAPAGKSISLIGGVAVAVPPPLSAAPPLSLGSRQDGNGNSDISTASSSSGHIGESAHRRAKLLGRLEEEKLKAARGVADSPPPSMQSAAAPADGAVTRNVGLDRISQAERPIAFQSRIDSGDSEDLPPTVVDVAEARLRRQAQLRKQKQKAV
ncbi:hypothetical protein C8R46DRAFT_1342346 [Mycena filopes]|nr:hypothetical protein C8R46DRAFT_1342346 [Mycena filopes]